MNKSLWKLDDETYEYIKNEISHLFTKYDIQCVPVSGFEIASKLQVSLVPYSSLSGVKLQKALDTSDDGFYLQYHATDRIYYNDTKLNYQRQNWTLLHEVGHIVLDHTGKRELADREEAEADSFAKNAIAPSVLIDRIQADSPEKIYQYFNISHEAARYAFNYYQKWKKIHRNKDYKPYEIQLLKQFEKSLSA